MSDVDTTDYDADDEDRADKPLVTKLRGKTLRVTHAFEIGESAIFLVDASPHSVGAQVETRDGVKTEQVMTVEDAFLLSDEVGRPLLAKLREQARASDDAAAGKVALPFDGVGEAPGPAVVVDADGTLLTQREVAAAQGLTVDEEEANALLVLEGQAWIDEHQLDWSDEAAFIAAVQAADLHLIDALDVWEQEQDGAGRDAVFAAIDARKEALATVPAGEDPLAEGLPVADVRARLDAINEPSVLRSLLLRERARGSKMRKKVEDAVRARLHALDAEGVAAEQAPAGERAKDDDGRWAPSGDKPEGGAA